MATQRAKDREMATQRGKMRLPELSSSRTIRASLLHQPITWAP